MGCVLALLAAYFSLCSGFEFEKHEIYEETVLITRPGITTDIFNNDRRTLNEYVAKRGCRLDDHRIQTADGYLLTLHHLRRLDTGSNPHHHHGKRPAILLQHGLLSSSADFLVPTTGLAYILCDKGYDVWLANNRGSVYSTIAGKYDPYNDQRYWNFSMAEFALYDLPAAVNSVCQLTGQPKVVVLGHSYGATQAMLVTGPAKARVAAVIALAPTQLLSVRNACTESAMIIRTVIQHLENVCEQREKSGYKSIYIEPGRLNWRFCEPSCHLIWNYIKGSLSESTWREVLELMYLSTSTKVIHEIYDVFIKGNPSDLFGAYQGKFDFPVHVFYSKWDIVVSAEDILRIIERWYPGSTVNPIHDKNFNHMDFLWGLHSNNALLIKILELLRISCEPGVVTPNITGPGGDGTLITGGREVYEVTQCIEHYVRQCKTNPNDPFYGNATSLVNIRHELLVIILKYQQYITCVLNLHFSITDTEEEFYLKIIKLMKELSICSKHNPQCKELLLIIQQNRWFIWYCSKGPVTPPDNGGQPITIRETHRELLVLILKYQQYLTCVVNLHFSITDTEEEFYLKIIKLMKELSICSKHNPQCKELLLIIQQNRWFIWYCSRDTGTIPDTGGQPIIPRETHRELLVVILKYQQYLTCVVNLHFSITDTEEEFYLKIIKLMKELSICSKHNPQCKELLLIIQHDRWFIWYCSKGPVTPPDNGGQPIVIRETHRELLVVILKYQPYLTCVVNLHFSITDTEKEFYLKIIKLMKELSICSNYNPQCKELLLIIQQNRWFIWYCSKETGTKPDNGGQPIIPRETHRELLVLILKYQQYLTCVVNLHFSITDTEEEFYLKIIKLMKELSICSKHNPQCKELLLIIQQNRWFIWYCSKGPVTPPDNGGQPIVIRETHRELLVLILKYQQYLTCVVNLHFSITDNEEEFYLKIIKLMKELSICSKHNSHCKELLLIIQQNRWFIWYCSKGTVTPPDNGGQPIVIRETHRELLVLILKYQQYLTCVVNLHFSITDTEEEFYLKIIKLMKELSICSKHNSHCKDLLLIIQQNRWFIWYCSKETGTRPDTGGQPIIPRETHRELLVVILKYQQYLTCVVNLHFSITDTEEEFYLKIIKLMKELSICSKHNPQCKELLLIIQHDRWFIWYCSKGPVTPPDNGGQPIVIRETHRELLVLILKYQQYLTCVVNLHFSITDTEEEFYLKIIKLISELSVCSKHNPQCKELLLIIQQNRWFIWYCSKDTGTRPDTGGQPIIPRETYRELLVVILKYQQYLTCVVNLHFSITDTEEEFYLKIIKLMKELSICSKHNPQCKELLLIIQQNRWFIWYCSKGTVTPPDNGGQPIVIRETHRELLVLILKYQQYLTCVVNLHFSITDTEEEFYLKIIKLISELSVCSKHNPQCKELLLIIQHNRWFIWYCSKDTGTRPDTGGQPIIPRETHRELLVVILKYQQYLTCVVNLHFSITDTEEEFYLKIIKLMKELSVCSKHNPQCKELLLIIQHNRWFIWYCSKDTGTKPDNGGQPIIYITHRELLSVVIKYLRFLPCISNLHFSITDPEDVFYFKLLKLMNELLKCPKEYPKCGELLWIIKSNRWFCQYDYNQKSREGGTSTLTNTRQELLVLIAQYKELLHRVFHLDFAERDSDEAIFIKITDLRNELTFYPRKCLDCIKLINVINKNTWFVNHDRTKVLRLTKVPNYGVFDRQKISRAVELNNLDEENKYETLRENLLHLNNLIKKLCDVEINKYDNEHSLFSKVYLIRSTIGELEHCDRDCTTVLETIRNDDWFRKYLRQKNDERAEEEKNKGQLDPLIKELREFQQHIRETMDIKIIWDEHDFHTFGDFDINIVSVKDYDDPGCKQLVHEIQKHKGVLHAKNIIIDINMDLSTFMTQLVKIDLLIEHSDCKIPCQHFVNLVRNNDWFKRNGNYDYFIKVIFERVMGNELTGDRLKEITNVIHPSVNKYDHRSILKLLLQHQKYLRDKYDIIITENETRFSIIKKLFLIISLTNEPDGCDFTCQNICSSLKENEWLKEEVINILPKIIQGNRVDTNFFKKSFENLVFVLSQHVKETNTEFGLVINQFDKDEVAYKKILKLLSQINKLGRGCKPNCNVIRRVITNSYWYKMYSSLRSNVHHDVSAFDNLEGVRDYQKGHHDNYDIKKQTDQDSEGQIRNTLYPGKHTGMPFEETKESGYPFNPKPRISLPYEETKGGGYALNSKPRISSPYEETTGGEFNDKGERSDENGRSSSRHSVYPDIVSYPNKMPDLFSRIESVANGSQPFNELLHEIERFLRLLSAHNKSALSDNEVRYFITEVLTAEMLADQFECGTICQIVVNAIRHNDWYSKHITEGNLLKYIYYLLIKSEFKKKLYRQKYYVGELKDIIKLFISHKEYLHNVFSVIVDASDSKEKIIKKLYIIISLASKNTTSCDSTCDKIIDSLLSNQWLREQLSSAISDQYSNKESERQLEPDESDSLKELRRFVLNHKGYIRETFNVPIDNNDSEDKLYSKINEVLYKIEELGDKCVNECELIKTFFLRNSWYINNAAEKNILKGPPSSEDIDDIVLALTKFLDGVAAKYDIKLRTRQSPVPPS